MSIDKPLADNCPSDDEDRILVMRARSGDREALEQLVRRHQAWIYNISVRMLQPAQRRGRDAGDSSEGRDPIVIVRRPKQFPDLALSDRRQPPSEYEAQSS